MEINTPIAEDIHTTDESANYDAACKRLLSEKSILAWIMKSCLEEYRDCTIQKIAETYIESQPQVGEVPVTPDETNAAHVRGVSNEDTSLTEGTVTYDIRFLASAPASDGLIQLIINVEAQGRFDPGYRLIKRGIYYGCRMISARYGTEFTHAEYQKIKKEHVRDYDLLSVVMLCLGGDKGENYDGVLKLLDVLLSSEKSSEEKKQVLQNGFNIPMTQTLESEAEHMCNLSRDVMEKGTAKGMEKGKVEGILSAIWSLMLSMGWSAEQAMEALQISETDRSLYAALL